MSRPLVAVFGSSEPSSGSPLYDRAYRTGHALARAGYGVITGGYGGVMEAASRGAHDGSAPAVGILCATFHGRSPNRYCTETIVTTDLFARTRELIERACGFVVLEGKAGTLAELAFLWALERAGRLGPRPVVLLGDPWRDLLRLLAERGLLDAAQIESCSIASDPDDVVRLVAARST